MNYQHSYHAGSFTEVFKHIILVGLIKALLRKDNPFCVIDTHAGRGFYDLTSDAAKKTKEYESGIMKVMQHTNPPGLIKEYLADVKLFNNRLSQSTFSSFRYFVGSPKLMRHYLRLQDRMILSELHPVEQRILKDNFAEDRHVSTHLLDGYQALKAFLPPKERRGLILIDPPFERPNEFAQILTTLPMALKRFSTGIYAIWYPIKDRPPIDHFHRALKEVISQPMLAIEMSIYPENSAQHLNGSGMIIINPPWQFDKQVSDWLPWLWKVLSVQNQGQYRIQTLT